MKSHSFEYNIGVEQNPVSHESETMHFGERKTRKSFGPRGEEESSSSVPKAFGLSSSKPFTEGEKRAIDWGRQNNTFGVKVSKSKNMLRVKHDNPDH